MSSRGASERGRGLERRRGEKGLKRRGGGRAHGRGAGLPEPSLEKERGGRKLGSALGSACCQPFASFSLNPSLSRHMLKHTNSHQHTLKCSNTHTPPSPKSRVDTVSHSIVDFTV